MAVIKIRNNLRYYRQRCALSQSRLAMLSDVAEPTISHIERDSTSIPYPRTRLKLADALQTDVSRLFPPVQFR